MFLILACHLQCIRSDRALTAGILFASSRRDGVLLCAGNAGRPGEFRSTPSGAVDTIMHFSLE